MLIEPHIHWDLTWYCYLMHAAPFACMTCYRICRTHEMEFFLFASFQVSHHRKGNCTGKLYKRLIFWFEPQTQLILQMSYKKCTFSLLCIVYLNDVDNMKLISSPCLQETPSWSCSHQVQFSPYPHKVSYLLKDLFNSVNSSTPNYFKLSLTFSFPN